MGQGRIIYRFTDDKLTEDEARARGDQDEPSARGSPGSGVLLTRETLCGRNCTTCCDRSELRDSDWVSFTVTGPRIIRPAHLRHEDPVWPRHRRSEYQEKI